MIRYRNRRTGQVVESEVERPVFGRSAAWTQDDDAGHDEGPEEPNLEDLKRPELDARAKDLGVDDPESLPNKQAVIDAINAAQGGE